MSILDLLQHIVNEPAPRLVSRYREFPREAVRFVEGCVDKDPGKRKSPQDLLVSLLLSIFQKRSGRPARYMRHQRWLTRPLRRLQSGSSSPG